MVSPDSTSDHRRNGDRDVSYSQVLGEIHGTPWGIRLGRSRQSAEREMGRGTHDFIGVRGWGALIPVWAGVRLVHSNAKSGAWASPMGSYLRDTQGMQALGGRGDC